jgi:hypothetical protein
MPKLSDLSDEELASFADQDFRDSVKEEARDFASDAFDVYTDVMNTSDDDQARLTAANRVLELAGVKEEKSALSSFGVSEEVFKIALAGMCQLAGIARDSSSQSAILRNVSPAKSDPRLIPALETKDDSPMSRSPRTENNDAVINAISGERYEIIQAKQYKD